MDKLLNFINGKKTYIVAFGVAICVVLKAFGIVIPEVVFQLLGVAGLGAIRSALKKLEK